ncbi:hypothetical protein SAMN05720354_12318 [Nitrosospira sp. Nsp1]|nr:hypothetical protein SAMN05720354_12318 [Nitrosospira sp. Nsp1]
MIVGINVLTASDAVSAILSLTILIRGFIAVGSDANLSLNSCSEALRIMAGIETGCHM